MRLFGSCSLVLALLFLGNTPKVLAGSNAAVTVTVQIRPPVQAGNFASEEQTSMDKSKVALEAAATTLSTLAYSSLLGFIRFSSIPLIVRNASLSL